MAMGLPILISVPIGEATELIEENHAGIILLLKIQANYMM